MSGQERINGFYINQEINRLTCLLKGHPHRSSTPVMRTAWEPLGTPGPNCNQSHLWRGCWSLLPSEQGATLLQCPSVCTGGTAAWRLRAFLTPVVWRFLFWGFWGALRWLQPGLSITGQESGLSLALSVVSLFLYCFFSLPRLFKIFKHICLPCQGFVAFC